jgi:parallel beta-helix repeat protein
MALLPKGMNVKREGIKREMLNRSFWKILAILIVLLMLISCAAPSIAVDNPSPDNALNPLNDVLPSENLTADNTPFLLSSNTYYVPDDYAKIQWAVDNASAGDTIIIRDGTYTENVNVNKRLTITSENGSASTIVQAANSDDHVFEVTVDYVNISGFTVKGATTYKAGIFLKNTEHCSITNNTASNNYYGIYLYSASNNIVSGSNVYGNYVGIEFELDSESKNNVINDNNINSNNRYGIRLLRSSSHNTISNNYISQNKP